MARFRRAWNASSAATALRGAPVGLSGGEWEDGEENESGDSDGVKERWRRCSSSYGHSTSSPVSASRTVERRS